LVGRIAPTHEEISILFRQPFPVSYQRAPDLLTDEAYAIHMALRKTLLPRSSYPEGFTGLQQRLVLHILTHQSFDIIDLLLAEIEDVITDGMGVARQLPYNHWISYICSRIAPDEGVASTYHDVEKVQRFPTYRPTVPQDPRRGCHVLRAALERLQPEARTRVQGEDEALLQTEAALPEDLVWSDSDSSEEDTDFFPDPEREPSEPPTQSSVPNPPPPVSEAQVTQPSELTGLLQQQREDRLAAEEARRASEARFAQLQQEAARDRATADERFAGLLHRVTQQQDAQIQQMQQGMFAMFSMVQQLITHTGLVL
jgi:hypothetical protein